MDPQPAHERSRDLEAARPQEFSASRRLREPRPARFRVGRTSLLVSLSLFLGGMAVAADLPPDEPKAREIMEKVDARDDGDNSTSNLEMILIDKRDRKRTRELRSKSKDIGEDTYGLLFFTSPADVEDTGFLTFDYDEAARDDDQWLYLPALKKTKRIASSDKSGSFMGSDFSYADMTDRPLEFYNYRLLKEGEVKGHPVWIIEGTPNTEEEIDETGYTKFVQFIRKDNYVVVRSKIWVKKGKRNKYMEVRELEQIDGIWVPTLMTMTTKKGDQTLHRTLLRTSDMKFNQDLAQEDFSIRALENGL